MKKSDDIFKDMTHEEIIALADKWGVWQSPEARRKHTKGGRPRKYLPGQPNPYQYHSKYYRELAKKT